MTLLTSSVKVSVRVGVHERVYREVHVDDQVHVLVIYTTCRDVSAYQDSKSAIKSD